MGRPVTRTVSGATGASGVVALNTLNPRPFNVGLLADVTGTLTYSVEYTFDDVQAAGYVPASGVWNAVSGMGAQTADTTGSLSFPVTAVRLNVTAWTSGSVTLTVLQNP
jgi:hypothetical protein